MYYCIQYYYLYAARLQSPFLSVLSRFYALPMFLYGHTPEKPYKAKKRAFPGIGYKQNTKSPGKVAVIVFRCFCCVLCPKVMNSRRGRLFSLTIGDPHSKKFSVPTNKYHNIVDTHNMGFDTKSGVTLR